MSPAFASVYALIFAFTFFSCSKFHGKEKQSHFEISFLLNKEIYGNTVWTEPPQFALWLENEKGEIQTIFVTHCTAKDDWEGQAFVPLVLPFWVNKFKTEYKRKIGPTYFDPLPDAFSGATPKKHFAQKFSSGDDLWNLYLEVNVSGDYNEFYKQKMIEGNIEDFGNGQPSIVYELLDILNNAGSEFQIIGQSKQFVSTKELLDTTGITSAYKLLKEIELKKK